MNDRRRRSSGVQLHITSLPGGRLGRRGLPVRRLAGRGRAVWWQVLPLGPPDRYRSPYKSALGVRRLAGAARRPPGAGLGAEICRLPRAPGVLDRRLGALLGARRGRRPGPLRPRVGGAARATRPSAGCGSSATWRSTSRRAAPTTAPIPELFQTGAGGRRAARRLRRRRPAVGQPAVRLAGAAAPRLPLVGGAACGARWSCSTWRGSTTSAASSPTGRCPSGRAHGAAGGTWRRGPGRALFDALGASARAAGLPLVAEDLGVITAAGRAAARRARPARDARDPVRHGPRATRRAPTASRTTPPTGSSTPAPTTRTRCAAGTESLRRRAARVRRRRGRRAHGFAERRAVVGPDPAGASPRRPWSR